MLPHDARKGSLRRFGCVLLALEGLGRPREWCQPQCVIKQGRCFVNYLHSVGGGQGAHQRSVLTGAAVTDLGLGAGVLLKGLGVSLRVCVGLACCPEGEGRAHGSGHPSRGCFCGHLRSSSHLTPHPGACGKGRASVVRGATLESSTSTPSPGKWASSPRLKALDSWTLGRWGRG